MSLSLWPCWRNKFDLFIYLYQRFDIENFKLSILWLYILFKFEIIKKPFKSLNFNFYCILSVYVFRITSLPDKNKLNHSRASNEASFSSLCVVPNSKYCYETAGINQSIHRTPECWNHANNMYLERSRIDMKCEALLIAGVVVRAKIPCSAVGIFCPDHIRPPQPLFLRLIINYTCSIMLLKKLHGKLLTAIDNQQRTMAWEMVDSTDCLLASTLDRAVFPERHLQVTYWCCVRNQPLFGVATPRSSRWIAYLTNLKFLV